MRTTVYFIRHAQSDGSVKNEMNRPLTAQGMADRMTAVEYLKDVPVSAVCSSPYLRAVTTVQPLADRLGLPVVPVWAFREGETGDTAGIADLRQRQWHDHTFAAPDGESFAQVQKRVVQALLSLIDQYSGGTVAVGCHGMMLSTLVQYFRPEFDYEAYQKVRGLMPWIVEVIFEGKDFSSLRSIDPFTGREI